MYIYLGKKYKFLSRHLITTLRVKLHKVGRSFPQDGHRTPPLTHERVLVNVTPTTRLAHLRLGLTGLGLHLRSLTRA